MTIPSTQYFGGSGNDFLTGGKAGGDAIGGQGDDTYLFTFGSTGEMDVDEAGLDAARELGDFVGLASDKLDAISGGGGGSDVLELRNAGEMDASDLRFFVEGGKDLVIEGDGGSVRIKNMHEEATKVETLRIVGENGTQDIDIGSAFDDGLFVFTWSDRSGATGIEALDDFEETFDDPTAGIIDFDGYFGAHSAESSTELAFANAFDGWMDTIVDAGSSLPIVGGTIGAAGELAESVFAFQTPEVPDEFSFL
ncbi:hypothetical protein [Labrenzia sp. DG1229]|uniref:hypothetical protein n=1 Tax=Labrenzia sp. DG1229 TaxID=681847 RepID=UPI00048B61C3|nr:hypothetical protein [Labrenzia sp. DG1229]